MPSSTGRRPCRRVSSGVGGAMPSWTARGLGEHAQQHRLHPGDQAGRRQDQRVDVEGDAAQPHRPGQQHEEGREAHQRQGQPRDQEQPARREQQHEAQVAPAVAPAAQVRRARAAVAAQRHRHLGQRQAGEARPHHHLRGELHARALQPQPQDGVAPEGAQAAMEVVDRRGEEQAAEGGQDRVADPAVLPRHGPRQDRARRRPAGGSPSPDPRHHAAAPGTSAARRNRRSRRRRPSARAGRAPRRCRRPARCRSRGRRPRPPARPAASASACEPSRAAIVGDQHLAHDARPPPVPPPPRATQAARVSASFRQGIRMVSSTHRLAQGRDTARARPLEEHRPRSPAGSSQHPNRRRAPAKRASGRGCHPPQQGL